MVGVLAVAEDTADGVFALHVSGVIAVVELVLVIFHVTEDAAGVVVRAADVAVVFVVAPDAGTDITADDAACIDFAVNISAVGVAFNGVCTVRVKHTCDAAGDLGARFDITGVAAAGDRHLVVVALAAEIAEDAARAGVGRHLAGVGAVDKRRFVVFDPARHAARIAVARIDFAGVGAAVCNHSALAVADHAAGAVVVSVNRYVVSAVGDAQGIVRTIFANQTADIVVTVNDTVLEMDVFKRQVAVAVTDHHGKAVSAVVIDVVDINTVNGQILERCVSGAAEHRNTMVIVRHPEFINGMFLAVKSTLKIIVAVVKDVTAVFAVSEVDPVEVNVDVQIDRLAGIGRAGAHVVDKLREAVRGRNVVV